MTCFDPCPGTVTLIRLVPCVVTDAPLKPAPFTRLLMICCAVVMSEASWVADVPGGGTAFSVTVVPLGRRGNRAGQDAEQEDDDQDGQRAEEPSWPGRGSWGWHFPLVPLARAGRSRC